MKTVLHKAASRGHANHGWLESYHTFSFANYYNPQRIHFGALRVLNDDKVSAGMGFGKHPHDNMEIISIPLSGELEHKDSMGNVAVIKKIKGIGDKTAQRIVIDLKDKLGKAGTTAPVLLTQGNTIKEEALSALLTLGFNRNVAEKELNKVMAGGGELQSVEVLLREALKNL